MGSVRIAYLVTSSVNTLARKEGSVISPVTCAGDKIAFSKQPEAWDTTNFIEVLAHGLSLRVVPNRKLVAYPQLGMPGLKTAIQGHPTLFLSYIEQP